MGAIVIRRQGYGYAKASTSSRKLYELHAGNEVAIDDPDELSLFYRATIDSRAVYILKEEARRTSSVTEGASTPTPHTEIASEYCEGRSQSEHEPESPSARAQAHAARGLTGEPGPPRRSLAGIGVDGNDPLPWEPSAIPWRRVVTGLIGLGMVGIGLYLFFGGLFADCGDPYDGQCRAFAGFFLLAGPVLAVLGTPVVLAAVRRPGAIPRLVVAVCITLALGAPQSISAFAAAARSADAPAALVMFVVFGGVVLAGTFTVAYLIAPREVSK
jgi:hypothetical protein